MRERGERAGPPSTKAAVGRAELAWLLARLPSEDAARAAEQIGFFAKPVEEGEAEPPSEHGGVGVVLREQTPHPDASMAVASVPFWRLEQMTFDDESRRPREVPEGGLLPEDFDDSNRTLFHTPPTQPLVPWSRLWPRLRGALRGSIPGRAIDVPALVRAWCRGEEVRHIPRVAREVWVMRASVWIDVSPRLDPLWADQVDACRRLRKVCGPGLEIRRVEAVGIGDAQDDLPHGYRPDSQVPVLVLGDLGGHGAESERAGWMGVARSLDRAGVRRAAVVPTLGAFEDRTLPRAWCATPWEPLSATPEGDGIERLLRLVSLAAFVQPGLLRELRLLLPSSVAGAATEIEVWQHRDVRADASGLVLHAESAQRLQREVSAVASSVDRAEAALLREAVEVIQRWHDGLPRELLRVEVWLWIALGLGGDLPRSVVADAVEFARRAEATALRSEIDPESAALLRSLGSKVFPLLPSWVYQAVPALQLVWAETFAEVPEARVPEGLDAVELRAALRASGPQRWWMVQQEGDRLSLVPSRGPAWVAREGAAGSPVAWLTAAVPEVLVRRHAEEPQPLKMRIDGDVHVGDVDGWVELRTDLCTLLLSAWRREPWATAAGRDRFGLWAAAEVNGVVQQFRWIPPGRFTMGSPESEAGRFYREGPQRLVTWTRGRWLAETPVTQALWEAVMGGNPSRFKSPDRPVEQVSWEDCKKFLDRLNAIVPGLDARLPSEAEWEHACRAGTTTETWLGDLEILGERNAPVLDAIAWYGGNCGVGFDLEDGQPTRGWSGKQYPHEKGGTRAVANKQPNPLGMYDMLGNVWEWCLDAAKFGEGYPEGDVVDPRASDAGSLRVRRGGSWHSGARHVRAAYRYAYDPSGRDVSLGFRLARGQEPGPEPTAEPWGSLSDPARDAGRGPRPARDALALEFGEDRFGSFMSFRVGEVVQRLRWVPAGTFVMGSSKSEAGRWEDEGPQHEVTISEGYWLGETPCTQALWVAVMGDNPSRFKSADRPVEQVSWKDCQRFLERVNDKVPELGARLPTEAEWERACRAGTTGATWVGELEILGEGNAPVLDAIARYRGNSREGFELADGNRTAGTLPVGKKKPNPLGLYDMLGNVWEWCEDWKGPYGAVPVIDPHGPMTGSRRVCRGGSWLSDARYVRAAYRYAYVPSFRFDGLGFRLARGQGGRASEAEPRPRSGLPWAAERPHPGRGTRPGPAPPGDEAPPRKKRAPR